MTPVYISHRWLRILKAHVVNLDLYNISELTPMLTELQKLADYVGTSDLKNDVYRLECSATDLRHNIITYVKDLATAINNKHFSTNQTAALIAFRLFLIEQPIMNLKTIAVRRHNDVAG